MDKLDFLDGPTPEPVAAPEPLAPQPVAEAPAAPVTDGPARGPDGKFAPKAVDAAPAAEAAPMAPADPAIPPAAEQPAAVNWEERFKEIEAQNKGLLRALTETRQQVRQPAPPAPDPFDDPEGFAAHQEVQRAVRDAEWSFKVFVAKNGEERGKAVQEWAFARAEADPTFNQRAIQSGDPFSFAAEEYETHQALSLLRDPTLRERFQAFVSGQAPAAQAPAAPVVVAAPQQPPTPPRSMAAAPSAGGAKPGAMPVGPSVAFDTVFKD